MTASPPPSADAVVIGAGPNGLVAANVLADAGWEVVVLEAQSTPGGAVRSAELTLPGFRHDVFSAFYPFAVGSGVMRELRLEEHGLRWRRAPIVVGHPTPDGPAAVLSTDREVTLRSLAQFAPGDPEGWIELFEPWARAGDAIVDAFLRPFPPVRPGVRVLRSLGIPATTRLARDALVPVRRMGEEHFDGAGGRLLLAGLALHADVPPDAAGSGFFGVLLAALGEQHGFPVPEGGAQELTAALVRRLERRGGHVVCDAPATHIQVQDGRAVAVEVACTRIEARRAVLGDVSAPALYGSLVAPDDLPAATRAAIARFEPGPATVKVDWALDGPVPWRDPDLRAAGTVHVADSVDELAAGSQQLAAALVPAQPFLLVGQMAVADPTRSPPGTDTVWAYTHVPPVPRGDAAGQLDPTWSATTAARFADRIEARIEAHAPGFRDRIRGRHILGPPDFARWDANLRNGDTMGGTAQLHQQVIFRPIPGWGRAETPIRRLYLASASAHPGGGVHGAPGANAARAALFHDRVARAGRRALHLFPRSVRPGGPTMSDPRDHEHPTEDEHEPRPTDAHGSDTPTGTDPEATYDRPGYEDKSLGQAVDQDRELADRLVAEHDGDVDRAAEDFAARSTGAPARARQDQADRGADR